MTTPDVRCTCVGTCHPERPCSVAEARAYLASTGLDVEPVTVKRHLARGWRWYARSVSQMLTDADLVEVAQNTREMACDTYSARVLAATDHIGRGRL